MKRSVAIIGMALLCAVGFFGLNKLNEPQGFDPDSIPDVVEYAAGVPGDTVVAMVDGEPITAESFLHWAGYTAETAGYYQSAEGFDWEMDMGGITLLDYVKKTALETGKLYRITETKAVEMGCGLSEEDIAGHQADYDAMVEQLGGQKEMTKWLMQIGLTDSGFEKVNLAYYFYQNILESIADVSPATEEEMADYIAANDILKAKHILIMTVDPVTREELSDEEKAEKKALAEDVLKQLRESEEPIALFDELMHQYSEDSGLAANPDGYIFSAGEKVKEFEQGTRDLEYDEISGIVESVYGYHIILRLNPGDETFAAGLGQALGQYEAQQELDIMLSDWMAEARVETTEAYDQLDIPAYCSNLRALREEIAAADTAVAAAK